MFEKKKDPKKVAAGRAGGLAAGKVISETKARASRINGAKGGRPDGTPITTEHARKAAAGRTAKLTPERRSEIARNAAAAREAKRQKP